jgi:hypothetical protein
MASSVGVETKAVEHRSEGDAACATPKLEDLHHGQVLEHPYAKGDEYEHPPCPRHVERHGEIEQGKGRQETHSEFGLPSEAGGSLYSSGFLARMRSSILPDLASTLTCSSRESSTAVLLSGCRALKPLRLSLLRRDTCCKLPAQIIQIDILRVTDHRAPDEVVKPLLQVVHLFVIRGRKDLRRRCFELEVDASTGGCPRTCRIRADSRTTRSPMR